MRIVTVKMPETYIEAIDELIRMGRYSSRSEVIRSAIRELLKKELWVSEHGIGKKAKRSEKTKVIELFDEV
ncbi:MAG: ribbon-helix-helix domain-containing protein [Ignisphaera sp.]|nr:ribbon-helix-helix domain-containing protein [Ignisphaera sp.]MCX8167910.1 ribbon-helix-helix domain-containing protein [Ignisphaera sp.]MDW8085725.1 ribbon-helix-helix domain-containing protein [Ignisphaera sp.]